MGYITLALPFNASGGEARLLLATARLFRLAGLRVHDALVSSGVRSVSPMMLKRRYRRVAYEVIPNRRYADGALVLLWGVYESAAELGVDPAGIEWRDWLMFQQAEKEYPCKTVTLRRDLGVGVSVVGFNGEKGKVEIQPSISRRYARVLGKLLETRAPYTGRVVLRGYGSRGGVLWVNGEVHLTIPLDVYYEALARHRRNPGRLYAGVDVNTDRVNLAIVDENGGLRDVKTFWFREVTARGYPRRRAWSVIGMRVHEILRYAYHHGVKTLFLENPDVLGKLRLLWISNVGRLHGNYNWEVATFRSRVIEMIARKAPLYAIKVGYAHPRGTTHSEEHEEAMRRHGLDRHTASAYLIAMKGLNLT